MFKRRETKEEDYGSKSEGTSGETVTFLGGAEVQKCNPDYFFLNWNLRQCVNSIQNHLNK